MPFDVSEISTPRLRTAVWTAGPEDGVPLLLVHGNLVTAGWWRYVVEEFLIDEVMRTVVGPLNYPGSSTPSANWPNVAPGSTGLLNAISPRYFDASALAAVERKVPITWIRGSEDPICSDESLTDFGNLGRIGAVPGWPGGDVMPPQPMVAQMRHVLTEYAAAGGTYAELAYDGVGHGIPVEVPARLAADLVAALVR